jgi:hypothetical protein
MRPHLPILCLLASSTLTACFSVGGGDCTPDPTVLAQLEIAAEDVRSLPVLSSKETNLLGIDVPDSHGEARFNVRLTNADRVTITGLTFEQSVDGADRSINIVSQRLNTSDVEVGDRVANGDKLSFFWRMRELAELKLPDAKPHASTVTMDWRFEGCGIQTGTAKKTLPGTVKAAVSATNLRLVSAEAGKPDTLGGARVKMAVASSVGDGLTNMKNARYTVTYFGDSLLPAIGLSTVSSSQIALQSGGAARTSFELNETLEVYTSKEPRANPAPYENAGLAAGTATSGKALITLTLSSSKKSDPATTQVDTISELVDFR